MNVFAEAIAWLFSAERLTGNNAIPVRLLEHVWFTVVSVSIAAAIAIPIGYLIGHTGRGRGLAVSISGAARALPSFGLILLLVLLAGTARASLAAIVAFVLLAVPSILAGAYAGIEAVDRKTVDAARAIGMTEWQILWRVEVPLGLPLLIGGIRNAVLQVVATVTLAAYVGLGGLGLYIFRGIPLRRYDEMLGSAILIVALALALDALFALAQRTVVPRGVIQGFATDLRASPSGRRAVVRKLTAD
ncbi:ABC transporter permease [Planctomonas psychrotolerans]|uniref:ABC transporter permease n=1 Tax=Planctomonas psychrotolerans TaxID=2528712 RepID=UPI00123B29A3|nr:ABC transporter permease subunit [Planctomonas psychrotolerans]